MSMKSWKQLRRREDSLKLRKEGTSQVQSEWVCSQSGCSFRAQTKAGLVNHIRQKHSQAAQCQLQCSCCGRWVKKQGFTMHNRYCRRNCVGSTCIKWTKRVNFHLWPVPPNGRMQYEGRRCVCMHVCACVCCVCVCTDPVPTKMVSSRFGKVVWGAVWEAQVWEAPHASCAVVNLQPQFAHQLFKNLLTEERSWIQCQDGCGDGEGVLLCIIIASGEPLRPVLPKLPTRPSWTCCSPSRDWHTHTHTHTHTHIMSLLENYISESPFYYLGAFLSMSVMMLY